MKKLMYCVLFLTISKFCVAQTKATSTVVINSNNLTVNFLSSSGSSWVYSIKSPLNINSCTFRVLNSAGSITSSNVRVINLGDDTNKINTWGLTNSLSFEILNSSGTIIYKENFTLTK